MANILLFSDIHIHQHRGTVERLDDCLAVLKWTLESAKSFEVDYILFLGDFFHSRTKIDTLCYCLSWEMLSQHQDIPLIVLQGNHDLWFHDRLDVSSVKPLSSLPHIRLVDSPQTIDVAGLNIDFIPYTRNPVEVVQEHFRKPSPVLGAHIAIDNAQLNKIHNIRSEVAVEIDRDMIKVDTQLFAGWDKGFLGHYHNPQRIQNLEYVGSPLELSFGEAFEEKHLVLLDTNTLKTQYIKNDFSPRHIVVDLDKIDEQDLNNNYVRIQVEDLTKIEIGDLRRDIMSRSKPRCLEFKTIKTDKEVRTEEVQQKFSLSTGTMMEKYANSVDVGALDRDKIIKYGWEICNAH